MKNSRLFSTKTCRAGLKKDKNKLTAANIHQAVKEHFVIYIHEAYGDKEVADIIKALQKVENAYLK